MKKKLTLRIPLELTNSIGNQIFEGFNEEVYLLVHHITGEQVIKKVAQKLIKSQGGGGVLQMENHSIHKLKMKAPHSVRLVDNQYWVFDSGHGELNILSKDWKITDKIDLDGWGRGACFLEQSNTFLQESLRLADATLNF